MNTTPKNRIGQHTGVVWRKELIAKLEQQVQEKHDPRDLHQKMMADARHKLLNRMRRLDAKGDIIQAKTSVDIQAVVNRYRYSAMDEGYINVYGDKAACML